MSFTTQLSGTLPSPPQSPGRPDFINAENARNFINADPDFINADNARNFINADTAQSQTLVLLPMLEKTLQFG